MQSPGWNAFFKETKQRNDVSRPRALKGPRIIIHPACTPRDSVDETTDSDKSIYNSKIKKKKNKKKRQPRRKRHKSLGGMWGVGGGECARWCGRKGGWRSVSRGISNAVINRKSKRVKRAGREIKSDGRAAVYCARLHIGTVKTGPP